MSDNFESMEELLIHAMGDTRINYYAYALGRSRHEGPTEATARLAMQLIFTQGPKWIELLERFAISNYQLIFSVFRDSVMVFPTLVRVAHPVEHIPLLSELEGKIFDTLESNPSDLAWCAFTELLRRRREDDRPEDRLNLLNRITTVMERNPLFLEAINLIQDSKVDQAISSIYSITNYKVFLQMVKLYKNCCQIFRKNMTYLQSTVRNAKLIQWMRGRYTHIFSNFQEEIRERQQGDSHFKEDLLECLCELKDFVEVQSMAIAAAGSLVNIAFKWSVMPNRQEDPEEQLNWEYGLIFGEYGEDLPSRVALTTNTLSTSVPSFLRKYLTLLDQSGRNDLPIGEFFMRTSVVHKIVNDRRDLVEELLEPLMGKIKNGFSNYSSNYCPEDQINFCRNFRINLLFSAVLRESYFESLIKNTLEMLRLQKYTSFCFLEGCNIFQQINMKANFGKEALEKISLITRQRVPLIVNGLLNIVYLTYQEYPLTYQAEPRQGKLYRIYTLLQEFLTSNQAITEGLVPTILTRLCEWTTEEASSNWRRGVTTTPVLVKLVKSCRMCITLIKEDYYCDMESPIYNLLELLKHHQSREFQEELLEILAFVISMEGMVSPPICTILTSLQRIVDQNKSLFCIINVIKALCVKGVAQNVLYEWSDLCLYFLNLFGNYINMINARYRDLYPTEFQEIMISFGMFLQVYEAYLQNNEQARSSVLYILQTMQKDELQLQLFIIMDHHRSVEPYRFLDPSLIPTFTRRNTFKMLHIHFCDQLLRDYSDNRMQNLIDLHKIESEKRAKKGFSSEVNADWPCLQTSIKHYLIQTLKELKKKGKIDVMEHSMYSRELDLKN